MENQQNIINEQNNKIKNLEEKINLIENENKKIIEIKKQEKINLEKFSIKKSTIIQGDEKTENIIKDWIDPNKNIKFSLLFRKTRDGSNGTDFHRNCDNKGPTITLIETDKGYKFGGYTPLNWESKNGENKNDELTFLFSLNQMKKFTKIDNSRSICLHKDYGPIFGNGNDLQFNKDMNTGVSNPYTFFKNRELTNGDTNFNVKEIEVFKVEFN